jgi:hypothetical protein
MSALPTGGVASVALFEFVTLGLGSVLVGLFSTVDHTGLLIPMGTGSPSIPAARTIKDLDGTVVARTSPRHWQRRSDTMVLTESELKALREYYEFAQRETELELLDEIDRLRHEVGRLQDVNDSLGEELDPLFDEVARLKKELFAKDRAHELNLVAIRMLSNINDKLGKELEQAHETIHSELCGHTHSPYCPLGK